MRRERPLTVPVRNHSEGDATPENWREVAKHRPRLARVGRSSVVDADDEAPGHGARLNSPVSPIARCKCLDRVREIGLGEVRPQDVREVELGVG